MDREEMKKAAAAAVVRGLRAGRDFVRVTGEGPLLTLKRRGDEIDDPASGETCEVLEGGVFMRCPSEKDGVRSWRWLRLGPDDDAVLEVALGPFLDAMDDAALAAVPADMAFQGVMADGFRR